jgi:hypothetical protein
LLTTLLVDITEECPDMAWPAPITYGAVGGVWDLRDIGDLKDSRYFGNTRKLKDLWNLRVSRNISAVKAPRTGNALRATYVPSPACFPTMVGIINEIIIRVIIHESS